MLTAEALRGSGRAAVEMLCEAADIHHAQLGEPDEAVRLLELAAASNPSDPTVLPKLAHVLEALEQWDRVVDVLREHVAVHDRRHAKDTALVRHELARVLVRLGRDEEAFAELRTAAKTQPTHPGILRDLGHVALRAGDLDGAERAYRSLFLTLRGTAQPANETISTTQVYLDLGAIALRKGDATRAAHLLESALEAAFEAGEGTTRIELALREAGCHVLLARALEDRIARTPKAVERAAAVRDLAELWRDHLGQSTDLADRIRRLAASIASELEITHDEAVWSDLWNIHASLGDELTLLEMARQRIERMTDEGGGPTAWLLDAAPICAKFEDAKLVERAIDNMDVGPARAGVRVVLARMLAEQKGNTEAAIAELTTALDESPTDDEAERMLADLLERDGRFDEVATLLERRFFGLGRDADGDLDAAWRVARALERAGRNKDAALLFEFILDNQPSDGETLRLLAERLEAVESERFADGLELWMRRDPSIARDFARRLVESRDRQGDRAAVIRALGIAVNATPWDRDLLVRLVEAQRSLGADGESLGMLDEAISSRPADGELFMLRAQARESVGDVDGAVDDLNAVRDPRHAERVMEILTCVLSRHAHHEGATERLAALAAASGDWARAADAYGELVRQSGEPRAHLVLAFAQACEHTGRASDACDVLERALLALPDDLDIARRLERACEIVGDKKRLASLLARRAEQTLNAAEKATLLVRAAALLIWDVGEPEAALGLIERALSEAPENIDVALASAHLYTALGRTREVIAALGEAVKRNRGKRNPTLANLYLEMAKAHLAFDELVEALDALKAGYTIDVRCPGLAMLMGLVAIDLGDERLAERAFSAVATVAARDDDGWDDSASNDSKVIALFHLASLAHAKRDLVGARRWAARVLDEDPQHHGALALMERLERSDARVRAAGGQRSR
jgi:tetratricopeptide (TPR) repeat protein